MNALITSRYQTRRTFLTLAAAMLAAGRGQAAEFREISWDDLVPAGWDPMSSLKEMGSYPDTDPRAQKVYDRMRKLWDTAPTVSSLAGQAVRLPGYLVPLDTAKDGIREFLLVPYYGACIHVPPPPPNQIVHVKTELGVMMDNLYQPFWIEGPLRVENTSTDLAEAGYQMDASKIYPYESTEN